MKNPVVAVAFATLALWGTSEALQRGTGRVIGTVVDTEGNPIAGAHILATLEGGVDIETTSDENGNWSAVGFRAASYDFTASADGYASVETQISVKELARNPPVTITLQKVQTGFASSGKAGEQITEANELFKQGHYDGARALYRQIIEENPALYQVHLNIGNVYKEEGNLDQALAEYQIVLDQEPSNGQALVSAGDVLAKQGKFDEAIPYFEQAVAVSPTDQAVPYNVAELWFNAGNIEKAIEFYLRATAIKPDWALAYLKTGYAYLNAGKMDEAAAQFQKVLEVAPEGPEAQQAQAALTSLGK